ncbi:MAG: carboxymuconolactone decarboxylase family protein [Nitrospinota bacterium]|nr:carboxymuconolactone decarboxylase family protein [Nitrospinota bacterium]
METERYENGKAIALSVLGKSGEERIGQLEKISPMHGRAIFEYCYGTVWAQPNLSIKIKEFILIAVCASQGEYDGVERQVRGALNKGATQDEIIESITTCAPYIGYPRTNASLRAAQEVFDQWDEKDDWKGI